MNSRIIEEERVAAEKVSAELSKPLPRDREDLGDEEFFNPWRLFPALYGSYSKEFDDMALHVLWNLYKARHPFSGRRSLWDDTKPEKLAHHMFREMLCTANLCDYGTSPRSCFATEAFGELLPVIIGKWSAYYAIQWGPEPETKAGV